MARQAAKRSPRFPGGTGRAGAGRHRAPGRRPTHINDPAFADHVARRAQAWGRHAGTAYAEALQLDPRDARVLARLPPGERHLQRNRREDLIRYLEAWAELLREQLDRRLREAGNAA